MPTLISTEFSEIVGNDTKTLKTNEIRNDEITLVNYGNRVTIRTWFGLRLNYAAYNWALDIFIPECYMELMEGLCGNYNFDGADDFTSPNGTIFENPVLFGQSWKTADVGVD